MPDNDMSTQRELATHAADIKHLQEDMDRLVATVADMQKTLTSIDRMLSEAKGGWKVLMLVGGASGAVSAIAVKLIHWYAEGR